MVTASSFLASSLTQLLIYVSGTAGALESDMHLRHYSRRLQSVGGFFVAIVHRYPSHVPLTFKMFHRSDS